MTALLPHSGQQVQQAQHLQPTLIPRDLQQIADLIEICFQSSLDSSGRAAVREMKTFAKFGPLLWILALLDKLGLGIALGFVWRDANRVVGNVSIYRSGVHPNLGHGWLIANVAVHPDHRRKGIARSLVTASLNRIRELKGRWAVLQVEEENQGAIGLYKELGFETFETLSLWEVVDLIPPHWPGSSPVRRRRLSEASAEAEMIFKRARRGAMAWTRSIEQRDIYKITGSGIGGFKDGALSEHWILPDPNNPSRLLGSMWVEAIGWRRARLTLFLDPAVEDEELRKALLIHTLTLRTLRDRRLRLETYAGDEVVDRLLTEAGFKETRRLVQMRKVLN